MCVCVCVCVCGVCVCVCLCVCLWGSACTAISTGSIISITVLCVSITGSVSCRPSIVGSSASGAECVEPAKHSH